MRHHFLVFTALLWAIGVLCAAPNPAQAAQTWALLIGVSQYESPQISSLNFPAADAQGIHDALINPELGAVPEENIRLLTNTQATREGILKGVTEFLQPNVQPGDQVILFLAGHGVAKGVGTEARSYLLPNDAKGLTTAALKMSAVDLAELSDSLAELPASQFIVFVDACREDPTPGRGIKGNLLSDVMSRSVHVMPKDEARPATSVTFFACGVGQRAYEDPTLKHGVFTYWILDGIEKAAVAQKPDGAISMGRLASYVSHKVEEWSQQAQKGGFEIDQRPETLASEAHDDPLILMRVKRDLPDTPYEVEPPTLIVPTFPEGAQVKVNGQPAGAGSVIVELDKGGEYEVEVIASGYEPASRTVRVLDGLQYQIPMHLKPGARAAMTANPQVEALYQRALEAEARQQYEMAQAGYGMVIGMDVTYQPAYERLASLHQRAGNTDEAIKTLVQMVGNIAPSARSFSLLSRAYADFAAQKQLEAAATNQTAATSLPRVGNFGAPQNWPEAAAYARKAADEAIKLEQNSAAAQLALGFALTVAPDHGKNKAKALAAFGKAAFMEPKDADAHYGLGYGIRSFAVMEKNEQLRKTELQRAVNALKEAIALRPDFYQANRELAYCYHLLDQTEAAMRHYKVADSNRGSATNKDDVAGANVALSALYRQAAQNARNRNDYILAADAYMAEARETSPDLRVALSILNGAGLNTHLTSYLPTELQQTLRIMNNPAGAVENELRNRIPRLPGGFGGFGF